MLLACLHQMLGARPLLLGGKATVHAQHLPLAITLIALIQKVRLKLVTQMKFSDRPKRVMFLRF